eukprot:TRINITY_DN35777_c0_g1_i1.p1 TRINITY_DN35777_c0_g1~~TRINITY_DN35777_c0_g1_i1.p1  ORF type:complete len:437 (+),score=67.48 TRINITY_DN35777_c0_g1_i1:348-1658(+)
MRSKVGAAKLTSVCAACCQRNLTKMIREGLSRAKRPGILLRRPTRIAVTKSETSSTCSSTGPTLQFPLAYFRCSACIQTIPELKDEPIFGWLNAGFTIMFTMELSLRLLASQSLGLFLTDHYNLIDILAVMPGYLELADSHWPQAKAFMSLRIIRLLWVLQMMRLAKVTLTSKIFGACLSMSAKICHTSILVEITLILGLATVSAGFLYLAESDYCDAVGIACRGFESIPAACWFAVTTLTTVGYGDSVPMTVLGKVFAAITSICGIMVVSLAGAMLSWDFAEHFREERVKRRLEAQLSRKTPAKVLEDYQEMQETLSEFSEACNSLMASLSHASANSSLRNVESEEIVSSRTPSKHAQPHGSVLDGYIAFDNLETEPVLADSQAAAAGAAARQQLVKGPMLRLLQERARVLCEEAKGAAFACLADSGVVLSGRGL